MASLTEQAKTIEAHITAVISAYDIDTMPVKERDLLTSCKQVAIDARLDARDYEYAETRAEQQKVGAEARDRLKSLSKLLLQASQYNVFGPVDIAQLSAQIEQLIAAIE